MKPSSWVMALALASCGVASAQEPEHPAHWDYSGEVGPDHWVEFGAGFAACAGRNQSPIDLKNFIEAELPAIAFDYRPGGSEVVNNGHSIQVNYSPGSSISIDSTAFALKQFHFHSPSENHIGGKSFPIEAHFVHADASGNLAVVAVMLEQGNSNPALGKVWGRMPDEEGGKQMLQPLFAAVDLLPANRDYYRYDGSLTTPPCSEGVRWLVLKEPVPASSEQIERLTRALGRPNNRPLQAIGARAVLQ